MPTEQPAKRSLGDAFVYRTIKSVHIWSLIDIVCQKPIGGMSVLAVFHSQKMLKSRQREEAIENDRCLLAVTVMEEFSDEELIDFQQTAKHQT